MQACAVHLRDRIDSLCSPFGQPAAVYLRCASVPNNSAWPRSPYGLRSRSEERTQLPLSQAGRLTHTTSHPKAAAGAPSPASHFPPATKRSKAVAPAAAHHPHPITSPAASQTAPSPPPAAAPPPETPATASAADRSDFPRSPPAPQTPPPLRGSAAPRPPSRSRHQ